MKKRIIYLDVMRAVACMMIVGVHVCAQKLPEMEVTSFAFGWTNAVDCFCIIGVPLFVMISGALMLREEQNCSLKNLYLGHILRLVVARFFWVFVYNLVSYVQNASFSFRTFGKDVLIDTLWGGGTYHMWFVPMIIGLYMVTPILRRIAKEKRQCEYFLALFLVLTLLYNTVLHLQVPGADVLHNTFDQMQLHMFEGYVGYYVLGYYLAYYCQKLSQRALGGFTVLGVLGLIVEITVCNLDSIAKGAMSTVLNDPLTINAVWVAVMMFLWIRKLGDKLAEDGKIYWFCRTLGKYSFGIYLIHPLIIELFGNCGIHTLLFPVIFSIPVMIFMVLIVSFAVTWVVSQIPKIGWYLI